MKFKALILAIMTVFLLCFEAGISVAATNVSLVLNTTNSVVGGSVTASGTADANTWVSIKVLNNTQSDVFFDDIKSDANDNYSDTFTVPSVSPGTLTVVAGYGSNVANANLTINSNTQPLADIQAPTWPTGAVVTVTLNQTQATLTWPAATDNVGVVSYEILRNNVELGTVNGSTTTYTDTTVPAGTGGTNTWEVEAVDATGNVSAAISGLPTTGQSPLDFDVSQSYLVTANVSAGTATDIGPIAGSTSVPVSPTIMLYFDRGVTTTSVWSGNQSCITLQDSSGANVPITVFWLSNLPGTTYVHDILLTPVSNLTPGKTYTITISKALTANNGNTLGESDGNTDQTVTFTLAGSNGGAPTTVSSPNVITYQEANGNYVQCQLFAGIVDCPYESGSHQSLISG